MSFSIMYDLDLSTIKLEQLNSFENELKTKLTELEKELRCLKKQYSDCDKNCVEIKKHIKNISVEVKRRQDIEEAKNISENIKKMEGFELLSEDELSIISSKMDKTDYRKYGNYPRYLDLERICGEVINMKKKYPKWTLSELSRRGQYDTLPPTTFYKYEYKDEYGCHFNLGGIKILST